MCRVLLEDVLQKSPRGLISSVRAEYRRMPKKNKKKHDLQCHHHLPTLLFLEEAIDDVLPAAQQYCLAC
jgi:hypothetical protein